MAISLVGCTPICWNLLHSFLATASFILVLIKELELWDILLQRRQIGYCCQCWYLVFFYVLLFIEIKSPYTFIYDVLNGAGHLWYLIMLFWCFIEAWLLMHIKIDERIVLFIIAFFAVSCSWMPTLFRLSTSLYYLFFFYLSIIFVGNRKRCLDRLHTKPYIIVWCWVLFIISYVVIKYVAHFPLSVEGYPIVRKAILLSINELMQMVYSTIGVIAFYFTALWYSNTSTPIKKELFLAQIGNYCFGIYIFQQFVLKWLYYRTCLPETIGPILLPWVGLLATIIISFILVYLIRLSELGRRLL